MASLQLLCVALVLLATAEAQEPAVADRNSSSSAIGNATISEISTPKVAEKPAESVVIQKPINQVVVNGTPPILPDLEPPKVAAKQAEGTIGLKKPLIAEPVAVRRVLGSRCFNNSDCLSITNSSCRDGVCVCSTGFIPSKHSLDKCVKVPSGLDDACEEEAQCNHAVPDSECRDSICTCPPHYIFNQGRCWEKQMLGGICNNSLQCDDVTFATCTQGVCTCEPPLIPSPINKCLAPAGDLYLAPCVEDIQCTHSYGDEARCSDSQCRCISSYHYNGTTCIPDKKLGHECLTHEECAVSDLNYIEGSRMCLDNICACATGYNTLSGEDICTKSSGEELAVSLTWILCIVIAKYYLS